MRRHVQLPYTVETWARPRMGIAECGMRNVIRTLSLIAEGLCYIGIGIGIALIVQTLHRGGILP